MQRDYSGYSIEQLEKSLENIKRQTSSWKTCSDGSYQMALDSWGYFDIVEELNKRRTNSDHEKTKETS